MTNETYVTRALPSDPLCRTGAEFAREVVDRRAWRIDAVHRTAQRVAALLGASASLCGHARRVSDCRLRPRERPRTGLSVIRCARQQRNISKRY